MSLKHGAEGLTERASFREYSAAECSRHQLHRYLHTSGGTWVHL